MRTTSKTRQIIKNAFSMHDTASYDEIEARILDGADIRGTNLCILMLAIFIASIGLNMNSTAVIIGAMLISPLMGSIMGMGYGFATGNLRQVRNAAVGLGFQVLVCLITSSIYFAISPINTACSELLARTNPTIWDVLIAVFGGTAGIIGITRKEKSNIIPGVAIATAIMPPLCTAGYGIAIHNLKYFLGAMYLFLINAYFIMLTTSLILLLLKIPKETTMKEEQKKRLKKRLVIMTIITILPSIFLGWQIVKNQEASETLSHQDERVDALEIELINKQVKIIFPEIKSVEAGFIDGYDEKTKKMQERFVVLVDGKSKLDQEQQMKLEKWLKLTFNQKKLWIMDKNGVEMK